MKKSILSKLMITLVIGLFSISNLNAQTGTYDAIHTVLMGSTYEYNVALHGSNTYTWEIVNPADPTDVLEIIADKGINKQNIFWDPTKTWVKNGDQVILRVSEFRDHGDGDVCSSVSEITISFTNSLPSIEFVTVDNAICSTDATQVTVKFNGVAPWDITITDDQGDASKTITGLTTADPKVIPVAGEPGYYTYTFDIAEGDLLSPTGDVTHALTFTTFVDDNVRKNATEANGTMTGTLSITVYQLPQISTINHN